MGRASDDGRTARCRVRPGPTATFAAYYSEQVGAALAAGVREKKVSAIIEEAEYAWVDGYLPIVAGFACRRRVRSSTSSLLFCSRRWQLVTRRGCSSFSSRIRRDTGTSYI